VLGYSNNGLEMWAYPVQILKAYRVSFRAADTTTEVDGPAILRRIAYSPESITRTYLGSDFIVREKLFVPLDEPGAIISYDVESNRPLDIVVRFAPVLDLMWPASLGGQENQLGRRVVLVCSLGTNSPIYSNHRLCGYHRPR